MYGVYTSHIFYFDQQIHPMAQRQKRAVRRKPRVRSGERLLFAFHDKDSPTGVRRQTVRRLATELGMNETRFLHLGAARLVEQLSSRPSARKPSGKNKVVPLDDGRMTDEQIEAIRSTIPQNRIATSTFLDLLHEPD